MTNVMRSEALRQKLLDRLPDYFVMRVSEQRRYLTIGKLNHARAINDQQRIRSGVERALR
jgi:hypothetical protein